LSATPDYTYVLDVETGELVYGSRRNDIAGITVAELEALGTEGRAAMIHPDDRVRARDASLAARELDDGQLVELRYRGRHADGGWRWFSRRVTPFRRDQSGKVVETLGVIRDITDSVEAQERITDADRLSRAAETHFEIVFEQAGIGAAIVGLDGIPTRVNRAVCSLFGRSEDELVGRLWTAYNHPDEVPLATAVLAEVAAGHDSYADERRFLRPDGSVVWASMHVILVRDEAGEPQHLLAQLADITERKQMETKLAHQALHDRVTDLPNRSLFADRVRQLLTGATSEPGTVVVMLLAGLHTVIDKDGYAAGDAVLKEVARRLVESVHDDVTIGHLQPGQFALLVKGSTHESVRAAEQALATLDTAIQLPSGPVRLRASVGISAGHLGSEDPDALVARLIQDAATAAGRAKTDGADSIAFASPEMRQVQADQRRAELLLRDALHDDRIRVAYQPVVDLATGRVVAAEALLRISDSEGRPIPPEELIPVAEESGLIIEIGIRVLRLAARQAAAWLADHGVLLPVAVNVSAVQVERDGFLNDVLLAAELAGVPPQALTIELTESVLLGSGSVSIEKLRALRDAGIQLAIDDFGTGYASLSYLRDLPASTLKIDRSFVAGIPHDRAAVAIVASVIGLARNFGMTCIAEGIETEAQLAYLAERGVLGQGYLLGRPDDERAISDMLARARSEAPLDGGRSRPESAGREAVADRRDDVADERDRACDQRDLADFLRDKAGDRRDAQADQRDKAAARRDRVADSRDRIGTIPDQDPDPRTGDEPVAVPALAGRGAAEGRRLASEARRIGATKRTNADVDRADALIDRHARATERDQAELDRNIARADRGSGAHERGEAEDVRDTAEPI
jgi:PAS domain S-box-containing protein/diguanylate cyclase (GGDEF)-like protein